MSNKAKPTRPSAIAAAADSQPKLRVVSSDEGTQPTHKDGVLRASDFRMRNVRWVWNPYLPLGKITIFDGDPGRGKSQITLDLAARITLGLMMPQMGVVRIRARPQQNPPRGVVMICAEDEWSDTVLPRLVCSMIAAKPDITEAEVKAGLDRVAVVNLQRDKDGRVKPLEFPRDVATVKAAIASVRAVLVVVDPIMAFLGEQTNTGSDASVRKALGPFKTLAAETGAAFVLIRHLNKQTDLKAEYRGGGSHGGFIGLARSAWIVAEHPEEPSTFVFVHSKSNVAQRGQSLCYQIVGDEVSDGNGEPIETSRIEWLGSVDMDAETLMRGFDGRKSAPARDECWEDMKALLEEQDPRPTKEMQSLLVLAGHTADTIKRTKSHYKVRSIKQYEDDKIKGWSWTMEPQPEVASVKDEFQPRSSESG